TRTHVQSIVQHSTEHQVGAGFGQMDFAEQVAASAVAADTVLLGVAPTHAAPDAAFGVAAHAVGKSGCEAFRKDFPVGHLAGGDVNVKGADMGRTAMGD